MFGLSDYVRGDSSNAMFSFPAQSYHKGSVSPHVFLCHSGKQKNFIRQLHRDLTLKERRMFCFFDEDAQSLPKGEKFPHRIFEAAEKCRVAVLVISKEFVQSKWPMLELCVFVKAKNSGKNPQMKILPLFFMISTKDLSQITEDNQEWKNLGISNEQRSEWHDCLQKIRSFNGFTFVEGENEVDFRDNVVKTICSLLVQSPMHFGSSMQDQARQSQVQVVTHH